MTTKRQVHLVRPEHALDVVCGRIKRSDAESLICIDALGGEPQCNVTSVESTLGVLTGSSKWVQGASREDSHVPAEGSDLTTSYCGDGLTKHNLDAGQLELESHTSLRQLSCGTHDAWRSRRTPKVYSRLERINYSEWTNSSGRELHAAPLDRH